MAMTDEPTLSLLKFYWKQLKARYLPLAALIHWKSVGHQGRQPNAAGGLTIIANY